MHIFKQFVLIIGLLLFSGVLQESSGADLEGFYYSPRSEAREQFLDKTAEIRRKLVGKEAEYNALQAQDEPDPKKMKQLALDIFDLQEKLRKIAETYELKTKGKNGHHKPSEAPGIEPGIKNPSGDSIPNREIPARDHRRNWYCW